MDGCWHWVLISVPKLVIDFQHEEAYVVYGGYLVITSDQKFLVEGVEMRTSLGDDPRPDLVQATQEIYVDYVVRGSLLSNRDGPLGLSGLPRLPLFRSS